MLTAETTFLLIFYISDAKLQLILENKKSFGIFFRKYFVVSLFCITFANVKDDKSGNGIDFCRASILTFI